MEFIHYKCLVCQLFDRYEKPSEFESSGNKRRPSQQYIYTLYLVFYCQRDKASLDVYAQIIFLKKKNKNKKQVISIYTKA